ncbi:complement regulator-acquiring protein [Borreliella lusitaniae]|uniref:complement regulator-acquiring protein n=1 Tax=Borreliella lusitaniae TaxID=100177 RepID=UPI003C707E07
MKKPKINIIKLNIIKVALALICISCAPTGTLPSAEPNKEISRSEKNKDSKPFKKDSKIKQDSKKSKAKKLKAAVEQLEAQKAQENKEIAKIDSQSDFLSTFEISSDRDAKLDEDNRMQLKRIIYSSLNYETQKINTLKEILEKLKEHYDDKRQHIRFMNNPALAIQVTIEDHAIELKTKLPNLNQEEGEKLLNKTEQLLKLKQEFATILNTIIQDYNQNNNNIKTDAEKLKNYVEEAYENFKLFGSTTNTNKN